MIAEIKGWMTAEELQWLGEQAARHKVIVELGCYQGRSTRALGENADGTVYAIDDWKGLRTVDKDWWEEATPEDERETLYERFCENVADLIQAGRVKPIKSNHAEVKPFPCDMVFIDGDHSYEGVKRDIETWLPFLAPGGLMCGHDFNQVPVVLAVTELLAIPKLTMGLIWSWTK